VHDEPALHFLTHAAGDHHHDREHHRVAAGPQHVFERIARDVVQLRRILQHQHEDDHHEYEHRRKNPEPEQRLPKDRPCAKQHLPRRFVVHAEEEDDERDDEDGVEERNREHERRRQSSVGRGHVQAEPAQDHDEDDLRRKARADDHFDERRQPIERQHRTRYRNVGRLRCGLVHKT
jgi:hypothetical protein